MRGGKRDGAGRKKPATRTARMSVSVDPECLDAMRHRVEARKAFGENMSLPSLIHEMAVLCGVWRKKDDSDSKGD